MDNIVEGSETMNIQKFTQKSIEAVNDCEKLAYDYGNQEIEQEHLLVALLSQEDGLIPKLIDKMEINVEHFTENAKRHLAARTKVSGSSAQVYVGNDLNKVLIHAEDEAKAMGDEYVSVEHLFLCLLKYPNKAMKELIKEYGLTRDRFLTALSTVRAIRRSHPITLRPHMIHLRNTATTWWSVQDSRSLILLSAVMMRYEM